MPDKLPTFKYHPDPLATGSVERSKTVCACCNKARGHIYTGPVYSEESYDDCLCPWCIADGSAHKKLGVEFHDGAGVGGGGEWDEVPDSVVDEITQRTPGFSAWQQEQWWTHCNDAAQFIGRAGHDEVLKAGPKAVAIIKQNAGIPDEEWDDFFESLDKETSPTAYLFKCAKCGQIGGYTDMD